VGHDSSLILPVGDAEGAIGGGLTIGSVTFVTDQNLEELEVLAVVVL
jgi:hypothetical protein